MEIFKRKEPRDLAAAYRFYCQKSRDDLHSSGGDVDSVPLWATPGGSSQATPLIRNNAARAVLEHAMIQKTNGAAAAEWSRPVVACSVHAAENGSQRLNRTSM